MQTCILGGLLPNGGMCSGLAVGVFPAGSNVSDIEHMAWLACASNAVAMTWLGRREVQPMFDEFLTTSYSEVAGS